MRLRWLFWLLVITFLSVVISRLAEVQKLVEVLARGQWQWVLVAALFQILFYILFAALYRSAFDTVEVHSSLPDLLPLTFASVFISVAAPSGGASSAALFVDDANQRGESGSHARVGTLLVRIVESSAFLLILLVGTIYLFRMHDLTFYEILWALLLLAFIGGLSVPLLLGLWQPDWLRRLLAWVQRTTNQLAGWLKRPHFLSEDWSLKNGEEFTEAALATATHPSRLGRTVTIALAMHLINLTSLHFVFLAFHQPANPGILVAGFSMGVLFWIISMTPLGIGVVEGLMTLMFTSLGVPVERAAIIALAFRGLNFWLPMVIGSVLLRRLRTFQGAKPIASERTGVHLVALLAALLGVIDLLSAVTPSMANRLHTLERYSPFGITHGGHLTSALAGFALLVLSIHLWRGKRVAWLLAEMVLLITFASHLLKGLDYEEALLSAALAGWLFYLRPHFHARSDPPSIRQGLVTLVEALAFTLVYGTAGFYLLDRHFKVSFGLLDAVRQTIVMFIAFYNPGLEPITGFGRYFAGSIYIVGITTLSYAFFMLVRPVLVHGAAKSEDRKRALSIVETWGHSALARLALLEDKVYFFSPGDSLVAYVVKGRIALTLGDPIGPSDDFPACLAAFADFCSKNDWQPAFYQVLPDRLEIYKSRGYGLLCIGQEGIVDLSTFTLAGGENKNVRTSVNKMGRLGYRTEVLDPPHSSELLRELRLISDEWLTVMHGSEKRFSLGWFDENYLNSGPVMVLYNPEGQIDAFANIIHEYQASEVTIDLMRHRHAADKGQMDFLFASLLQWAKEKGYATFSLGLSALAGIGENPSDPAVERALHYIYEHVDQFYNFKGLHSFKNKFHPAWVPRYLVYPNLAALPAVTLAIIRADSGDDILGGYLRHS